MKEDDYLCPTGRLHDYSKQLRDDKEVIVEMCIRCGRKIWFKKIDGRIQNKRYGETHRLWFLQPGDEGYAENYGTYIPPAMSEWKNMPFKERVALMEEEVNQALKEDGKERTWSKDIKQL